MADLHKLLFETPAKVSDREILATARLNARVKTFAGREIADGAIEQINAAIADEADRLIAEGVLQERPDWLAALVSRRLYVAFGSRAVQHLSRELQLMGAVSTCPANSFVKGGDGLVGAVPAVMPRVKTTASEKKCLNPAAATGVGSLP